MESDYRIVRTPAELLARTGHRHLLVEAVELHGGAILRGAYVPPPMATAGEPIDITGEHDQVAAAFVQAAPPVSYVDARHAPRDAGPVAHARPWVSRAGRHL